MKPWSYALISTLVSLVSLILLLSVPLHSLVFGANRKSALYFARIDATNSNIVEALDKQKDDSDKRSLHPRFNPSIGLPDLYDADKIKQHYYIYLLNYCSGTEDANGKVTVDFCSKQGQEIWDLFALWSTFDPVTETGPKDERIRFQWLNERPAWLRWGYAAAAILSAASVVLGVIGALILRHGGKRWVMFYASVLSTIMLFVIAAATQVTFGLLVFHAEEQNSVKTKKGIVVYVVLWFSLALSIAASAIWFVYSRKSPSKRLAGGKSVNKDLEAISYKYEELKDDGESTDRLKGHTRTESTEVLHAQRSGHDPRFEPLRR